MEFMANLPRLLKKNTKGDPISDCTTCYNDILGAIESCGNVGDDTNEILLCVEAVLGTSADCVVSLDYFVQIKILSPISDLYL